MPAAPENPTAQIRDRNRRSAHFKRHSRANWPNPAATRARSSRCCLPTGVEKPEDLKPGMKLPGIVTNVTAFGAFVDIGVHQDGLVHVSQIGRPLCQGPLGNPESGAKGQVTVMEVDLPRKRIALSMKAAPHSGPATTGTRTSPGTGRPAGGSPRPGQPAKPAPVDWFTAALEQELETLIFPWLKPKKANPDATSRRNCWTCCEPSCLKSRPTRRWRTKSIPPARPSCGPKTRSIPLRNFATTSSCRTWNPRRSRK